LRRVPLVAEAPDATYGLVVTTDTSAVVRLR
jgi:hypothetical protein